MTVHIDLEFWRTATLAFVAVGQTLFVILYATFPWYKTFLGRALFYKALTLGAITDVFIASRVWQFAGQDVVFVVLYALLGIGVWWQLLAFVRVKRHGSVAPIPEETTP
jgi:ABC-type sugar transport system permease subunit